jgi:protein-S-isoprenylcysteine O-methyltransferase Ste14
VSTPLSPRTERVLQWSVDLGERIFFLVLFATFAVRLSHTIGVRPYNVLALISEGLVAFFILIRRPARNLTMRPLDWVVALVGTALAMFVRAGGHPLLPAIFGTVLMFAGLSLAIWAKLSLRRSFGLAAANRGTVAAGPYRFLRHPMYGGYIIVYVGFFLNNPLWWNLGLYIMATLLLMARLRAEEAVLKTDPVYDAYCARVPYRLIPALF